MATIEEIDRTRVPQHVAIIMDGNGRWALKQQHERIFGHHNGLTAVRKAVEGGVRLGVKYMTLYTFSTENWNRPQAEVDGLMELLVKAVLDETETLMTNNVRLRMIGDLQRLPERSRTMLEKCMAETAGNTAMTLILALSYSSRWEIAQALKRICAERLDPATVDEETLRRYLCTSEYPDPDLLIRTGGELRISNFLLWQMAYTEFYFTDILWPDFNNDEFDKAILAYSERNRRFGGV
jgi:undecaprenyl diphosphate synthase